MFCFGVKEKEKGRTKKKVIKHETKKPVSRVIKKIEVNNSTNHVKMCMKI